MSRNTVFRLRLTVWNNVPNMNNNNNQSPMMQMRDRLFHVMFVRLSIGYAKVFSQYFRSVIETVVLLSALISLFMLAYVHVIFVHEPMNCLDSIQDDWPRNGILRIEIIPKYDEETYSLEKSYKKEILLRQYQGYNILPYMTSQDTVAPTDEVGVSQDSGSDGGGGGTKVGGMEVGGIGVGGGVGERRNTKETVIPDHETFIKELRKEIFSEEEEEEIKPIVYPSRQIRKGPNNYVLSQDAVSKTFGRDFKPDPSKEFLLTPSDLLLDVLKPGPLNFSYLDDVEIKEYWPEADTPSSTKKKKSSSWPNGVYIMEYSLEYGFLKLSMSARKHLNIPVKLVVLDPENDKCFGSPFTKAVLEHFLGYDDILLASLSKLASGEENKGFIHNVVTEHYFRFVNVMNHSSYLLAAFVMITFTFFISTLLRYSHHQIFVFIIQVLRLFELRAATTIPFASLMTVILALVGMEAIMSEFFSDPASSFYVILVVWIADQFDAICCRTVISRRHWLRFFYLYHFAFYAYDYRFSGQYSYLALFTSCCFIFHSMVFFFHHYELPAILRSLDHHNNPHRHHHHHHHHHHHRQHHHHHNNNDPSISPPSDSEPGAGDSETSTSSESEINLLPESEQDGNHSTQDEGHETGDDSDSPPAPRDFGLALGSANGGDTGTQERARTENNQAGCGHLYCTALRQSREKPNYASQSQAPECFFLGNGSGPSSSVPKLSELCHHHLRCMRNMVYVRPPVSVRQLCLA